MIICGDFNLPNLSCTHDGNFTCSHIISDLLITHAFTQFVTAPTRYNSNSNTASLLDLVLCNDEHFIFNTTVDSPFDSSDHCTVHFDILNSVTNLPHSCRGSYDFKHADWNAICTFLNNVDFFNMFSNCDSANQYFDCFYSIINDCFAANIPFINTPEASFIHRYPGHIRRNFTRKRAAWRKYRDTRSSAALQRYKQLASVCRSSVYDYNVQRERKIVDSGNVSAFYRHCNRRFNSKSVIGPLRSPGGSMVLDSGAKAELFQRVFSQYYTHDNGIIPPTSPYTTHSLSHITFTPAMVNKAIKRLRVNSKGGPDCIPPEFFKKCCLWLSAPLAFLFQASFDESYIPPVWLTALVCPIFKKGDRSDPVNYRPISLTCVACKLMEYVIKCQLMSYLLERSLLSKKQHAFIVQHSTVSNLLECTRDWTIALNSRQSVDIVYVDYQRAFDSVVHNKLLAKLTCFGVSGKLLGWLAAFLSSRSQRVVIENSNSKSIPVVSGIIQGSVLGPVLFILYINDVSDVITYPVNLQLFADDLKLYSNFTIPSATHSLQQVLDAVSAWSTEWQLTINVSKCSCMRLSSSHTQHSPVYCINGLSLAVSTTTKDLGVITDCRLSYTHHITEVVSKANQRVGVLFRGFQCRDLDFLRRAFITYIRPLLEYCSVVWSPTFKKYIDQVESVQRRFSKRIPEISDLPYLQRLARLGLESLELRRLRFDLFYYYKIIHGLTPHTSDDFFSFHQPPSSLRDSSPLMIVPANANRFLSSSFRYRAASCWNYLPSDLKQINSYVKFKACVCNIDLDAFMRGSCYND